MRTHTYNQGAADARASFKRYVQRMRKKFPSQKLMLDVLLAWLAAQSCRCNLRKGGIGRK